jgi:hypothetical protein
MLLSKLYLRLVLRSDSIHCYKRPTIKYTIHNDELNEWNTFTWIHWINETYIIIITHDNISTIDLYTGNFYVACLDYLYTNSRVSVEIYCYYYFYFIFFFFSSPGHRPYELLSWVSIRRPSVRQLFTFKSSLKPLNRFQPSLPEMFVGWSSTRFLLLVLI